MPKDVQQKIREPIDKGANAAQREIDGAMNSLKRGAMMFTFGPTLIVYAVACTCSWFLFVAMAVDLIYYVFKGRRDDSAEKRFLTTRAGPLRMWPARKLTVTEVLKYTAAIAMYALLLACIIVTVVGLITSIVNKLSQAVHVQIAAGSSLIGLSWASFILMWVVHFGLKKRVVAIEVETKVQERLQYELNKRMPGGAPRAGPSFGDDRSLGYEDSPYTEKHNNPRS